mgnify:CR=1 FL=1
MNKKISFIIIALIFSTQIWAHIPTIDSLFRNGSNIDVEKKTVVARLYVQEIKKVDAELEEAEVKSSSIKLLMRKLDNNRVNFIQVDYRNKSFAPEFINAIKINSNLSSFLKVQQIETKLFYSLLESLLVNSSRSMINTLGEFDPQIKPNRKNINKEQANLLAKYKRYLKAVAEENEDAVNPLTSTEPLVKEKINKTLGMNFINDGVKVQRIFENNNFYLTYKEDDLFLKFDNSTHRLLDLKYETENGAIEVEILNYVAYSQKFEFPEQIILKLPGEKKFEITLKGVQIIEDTDQTYYKRIESYKKSIKNVEDQIITELKPLFIL